MQQQKQQIHSTQPELLFLKWWRGLHLASSFIAFYVALWLPSSADSHGHTASRGHANADAAMDAAGGAEAPRRTSHRKVRKATSSLFGGIPCPPPVTTWKRCSFSSSSPSLCAASSASARAACRLRGHQRILIASNGQNCCFHLLLCSFSLASLSSKYAATRFVIDVPCSKSTHEEIMGCIVGQFLRRSLGYRKEC